MGRAPPTEDDPAEDWRDAKATDVDPAAPRAARDPITAPHAVTADIAAAFEDGQRQGYLAGFEKGKEAGKVAGFRLGQKDAMDALVEVIDEHFGNDPVLKHVVAAIRSRLSPV